MTGAASDEVIYRVEDERCRVADPQPARGGQLADARAAQPHPRPPRGRGRRPRVRAIVLTASRRSPLLHRRRPAAAPRPSEPTHDPGAPDRPIGTVMKGSRAASARRRLLTALQDCPKPIIAAVNGTAAGARRPRRVRVRPRDRRRHRTLHRDLRAAGLIPDGGGPYLVTQLVGPQKAKELFFFGDDVPAEEACRIGLINRVVRRPSSRRGG